MPWLFYVEKSRPTIIVFERFQVVPVSEIFHNSDLRLFQNNVVDRLRDLLNSLDTPAKTAVIETDYIDVDYSASYYDQRARSFTPDKRGTTRVHFFSEEFSKRSLTSAGRIAVRKMQNSYLGFTVLRPETPVTLGRTFVACPTSVGGLPVRFPTRVTTKVDMAGIPLEVESCPYMSQDAKIMACATAALWMSTSNLVEKITNVPFHTTAEITALAMSLDRPFGPAIGRRGLSIVEMEHALFEMGLDPRRHPFPDADQVVEICHLFSDSGIPPVLGIESDGVGHAVTVVGYTLAPPLDPEPTHPGMFSAHQFVPYLVIQDDQRGMYLLAEVKDLPNPIPPWSAQLTIHAPHGPENALCTAILVPFPRRVMLDAYEARTQAEVWIPFEKNHGVIEDRDVVCRKLLVRSNAYKQTLLKNRRSPATPNGYPNDLVNFARQLPMPRYVWLIEVSYMNEWDPADPMSPPVIAEFVLDSTLTEARRPDFLMAHYPGTLFGNLVMESGVKLIEGTVAGDGAHMPFPDTPRP